MSYENYKLIEVVDRQWKQDRSGVYTVINYLRNTGGIRLDVMSSTNLPVVTIVGQTSDATYKGLADWIDLNGVRLSAEHSMYIGKELYRASIEKIDYVQD